MESVKSFATIAELEGGYRVLEINTTSAKAKIAFQGATLFEWQPADEQPVIFTSSEAIFNTSKAIRGGAPICWPWFGPHATDADKPQHGFVRNTQWELESAEEAGDVVKVIFKLPFNTHEHFPYSFELKCTFTIGAELTIDLQSTNLGSETFEVGGALHTYFHVADIHQTSVSGLDQTAYLDKPDNNAEKTQSGDVTISGEVDRVYLDTDALCTIKDPGNERQIEVSKENSATTVVWNPWIEKAAALGDMQNEEYLKFICVETVNTGVDTIELNEGESYSLIQKVTVK